MSNSTPILSALHLGKCFGKGTTAVDVLKAVDLSLLPGEMKAIVGSSGSGKSTLLHLLGGLDKPDQGEVMLAGERFSSLSEAARGRLRNRSLGFVYQFHHLLPELTAEENVAMPLLIRRVNPVDALKAAKEMLAKVGLQKRVAHKPGELSGGERQRTAIARAMVTKPACLLADEPTGNLDRENAQMVFDEMLSLNQEMGTALLLVTHDIELANKMANGALRLVDGVLQPA
ncbi:ATP-binding cassette domain-containing protein [Leeia sp. TBRC 13508]|uniref:ATP-binding cassette domain-containing protein n=1 Tax=Leeia speluncae TaxID=2884804 RepID=A0ABS8D5J3_9NEIS|nr:ATP-binding cassette domain-containing protein [Leeia speluncae]MCB6183236.1 ATP-binding cassette domain-containing protein [Leeia speluncae]